MSEIVIGQMGGTCIVRDTSGETHDGAAFRLADGSGVVIMRMTKGSYVCVPMGIDAAIACARGESAVPIDMDGSVVVTSKEPGGALNIRSLNVALLECGFSGLAQPVTSVLSPSPADTERLAAQERVDRRRLYRRVTGKLPARGILS